MKYYLNEILNTFNDIAKIKIVDYSFLILNIISLKQTFLNYIGGKHKIFLLIIYLI